jgi:DHA2 family multidrug resistance protein
MADGQTETGAARPGGPEDGGVSSFSKWIVALTVMLPTLIEIIDTSVVNVSLDHIRGALSAGIDEATWTITAYLVSNAMVIPMSGWLSRLLGRKRYQLGSIGIFTLGSFMCGSAWSLQSLIFFRVLQGLGGGGLVPVSQSILLEAFPKKQHGTAMALFGMGAMFGPIAGPLLGGWITDNWSWRWIFYVNIPIGILSIVMNGIVIKDPPYMKRQRMKIDYVGLLLLAIGLGSLQYVLDKGQNEDWFGSSLIVALSIVSFVAITFLVINELYVEHPIINLRLFKRRTFLSGNLIMFFVFFNLFGSIVLLPIFLQTLMGYTSFYAGLVLGPGGVVTLMAMPLAGVLIQRTSPKRVLAAGIILCSYTTFMMSQFNLQTDFWSFVWPRMTLGLGMGLTFIPLTTTTLSPVPKENMGEATSLYNLLRNMGGSVGIAFTSTMVARRTQLHQSRLGDNLSPFDVPYRIAHDKIAAGLAAKGLDPGAAGHVMYGELVKQASTLAFNDAFLLISVMMLCTLVLVPLMRRPPVGRGAPPGGH